MHIHGKLSTRKIFSSLLIWLFFHVCSLFLPSASYTLPNHYFINCGSASRVSINRGNFAGDMNPGKSVSSSGESSPVEDPTASANQLYQSARIFRKSFWYKFDIDQNGTYVVRFHFFPFSSMLDLSDARFNVLASGFLLLSNFTVGNGSSSNFPLIEEFLLSVPPGEFRIDFLPNKESGSFAFVNAIEVFLAPPAFIPDSAINNVTPEGGQKDYNGLLRNPLHVIHRINVGGPYIMPDNDTLLRNWTPDDDYIFNKSTARNSDVYSDKPKYQPGGATEFDAPDFVYKTAKQMSTNESVPETFNISWRFDVQKGVQHLVRVHFCDVVTSTANEFVRFNLYIYSNFRLEIWPYGEIPQLAAPFYKDFVVKSDNSGFMNITVGPTNNPQYKKSAFLNGVEIIARIEESGSAPGGAGSARNRLLTIIGPSVGGVILVLIILAVLFLASKRRTWKPVETNDWPLVTLQGGSSQSRTPVTTVSGSPLADLNLGLRIPFSEILHATNKFDANLMVGEGGFGKVYKGMLCNGTKVAVKRSQAGHGQGLSEFQTEIVVLSQIRHRHLVSLIGYCDERNEMILAYEFMEKGTLRDHLYTSEGESRESSPRSELSWDERLQICIGAAKGLHYLHTGSNGAIIHRDIKSTNILLDENFVAKVADFGLSRSGPLDQTHVSTEVKGSFGYLDPDYFKCLQLTQKSDVYSFGVVLLEALCARPAVGHLLPREEVNLADWGLQWQRKGQLEKIVDPLLVGKIHPDSLRKFGETVEKCLQERGADRPNMVDVLWDLEYCLRLQHTARPREPYEDSTTDVALGWPIPVVQRVPSDTVVVDQDELPPDSSSVSDASQFDAGGVFSQLKIGEAR